MLEVRKQLDANIMIFVKKTKNLERNLKIFFPVFFGAFQKTSPEYLAGEDEKQRRGASSKGCFEAVMGLVGVFD